MSLWTFLALSLTFVYVSAHSSSSSSSSKSTSSTIKVQAYCDNYCKIYYNGLEVFNDDVRSRSVNEFEFPSQVKKGGKRTFAAWLADGGFDADYGISIYTSSSFLTTDDGESLDNLFCLGDGGFRAVFIDDECGETIVTNNDWKCEPVRSGPLDVESCFENGFTTDPTYQNPTERGDPLNGGVRLYDPCIENPGDVSILDSCSELVISDYDQDWVSVGYNDTNWEYATVYTEDEAVPKGGRPGSADLNEDCTDTAWYCEYDQDSWQNSKFIWSDEITLDNVVLCRYEYESSCDSSSSSSSTSSSSSSSSSDY